MVSITTIRLLTSAAACLSAFVLSGKSHAQVQNATFASLPSAQIVAPARSYAFPAEKYVFSVRWQFFNAGTSTVSIKRDGSGLRVSATADSAGMPDKIFRVHDQFDSDVDPRTFCTVHVRKHNEEGSHRRDFNVVLDYAHGKSRVDAHDLKTSETKHTEFDIPSCATDLISGFFYVASLPLVPGFTHTFPVNDNGKTIVAHVEVESRDTVKSPVGEFQTLRVKAEPMSGPMKGKATLWVWFTDDARHMPVQMKSKLGFATLSFQLQELDPPPRGK